MSSSQILEEVTRLPVSEWSYKTDPKTRDVGPVAQDFYSVFNIGADDKHITTVDGSGVALAAIQGMNQKLDEKDSEIQKFKQQNETLEKTLEKQLENLEQMVKSTKETK